jgi:hypothetical protein
MAGVSSPMRRVPARWRQFAVGLVLGGATGGLATGLSILVLGSVLAKVGRHLTDSLLLGLVAVLGVADVLDRTPHIGRQVPQRFVSLLPPGQLGFVWGTDLGLVWTTQKTTSGLWVAFAGLAVVKPLAAPVAVVMLSIVSSSAALILGRVAAHKGRVPSLEYLAQGRRARRIVGVLELAMVFAGLASLTA